MAVSKTDKPGSPMTPLNSSGPSSPAALARLLSMCEAYSDTIGSDVITGRFQGLCVNKTRRRRLPNSSKETMKERLDSVILSKKREKVDEMAHSAFFDRVSAETRPIFKIFDAGKWGYESVSFVLYPLFR